MTDTAPTDVQATRTYTEVFGRVWTAAVAAAGGTRRWSVVERDPTRGTLEAEVRGVVSRTPRRVRVTISLDELGLTRVDAGFVQSGGGASPSPRTILRFLRRLDRELTSG